MSVSLTDVIASAAGGALGAALGALLVFSLMGVMVIMASTVAAATGSAALVTGVAFGPVFGPHVSFAGGVAAAVFAARRGLQDSGRDIVKPLIGHNRPQVLLVGAVFGVLGMLVAEGVAALSTVDHPDGSVVWTDALAVSVVVTGVLAHVLWGRSRDAPVDRLSLLWLPYQRTATQVGAVGVIAGAAAGAVYLAWPADSQALVPAVLYGFCALSLIGFQSGQSVPVTHHIMLPAALFAAYAANRGGSDAVVLAWAAVAGLGAAAVAELWARGVLQRVRTHLDPPAFAIAVAATVLALIQWVW